MKIKVLDAALSDLANGRSFYHQQGKHLGDYFLDSLFSDIDSLTLFAGIHQKYFGYFRMLAHRFPYAIYYQMPESDLVVVWRVLDMRANPKKTKNKLE
ncbi:ParE toxin of type II toxin-antitoxin system, parDE [Arsukibacterium tuosuense]|uniref:ParE toxin of type II toxin-antitoxin system, parDE n=1 Tax=Arsukibacterium tuosuense TaxID=1323745 RepID=A0A285IP38_9GAMM|nr:type II toxin-antitoxin system RelE/ParE family toxin [Arsukibacterium tuosuense]SNY49769.1 ParE toxin of type II toxin-antitoxin system, parDE [Arsukibacterium tuosuense]